MSTILTSFLLDTPIQRLVVVDGSHVAVLAGGGIVPTNEDILCGKDKNCVHAPGSVRFRSIIESYRAKYANSLTKFDKMQITKGP